MDEPSQYIDAAVLADLEREAPILSRLTRFGRGLDNVRWFAHLGERPRPKVRELSHAYLEALGFPDASLSILPTWEDAADAAETFDFQSPAWEAEELARADITTRALAAVSEEALQIGLSVIAQNVASVASEAMKEQAAYWDIVDEPAQNLAVGAAAQAANGAALLLIATAADPDLDITSHPLAHKFRLFELGRWPVSLVGGTFSLF